MNIEALKKTLGGFINEYIGPDDRRIGSRLALDSETSQQLEQLAAKIRTDVAQAQSQEVLVSIIQNYSVARALFASKPY